MLGGRESQNSRVTNKKKKDPEPLARQSKKEIKTTSLGKEVHSLFVTGPPSMAEVSNPNAGWRDPL